MAVVTVFAAKGGAGKTTLVVGLASTAPAKVLVIDCDASESAYRWLAALDLPDVELAVARSTKALDAILSDADAPLVLIDTPPLYESQGLVHAAVRAADVALTPLLPSPADVDRLPLAKSVAEEEGTVWRPVVSQERAWTKAGRELRPALREAGMEPLNDGVPFREAVRTAWGSEAPDPEGMGWIWQELSGK